MIDPVLLAALAAAAAVAALWPPHPARLRAPSWSASVPEPAADSPGFLARHRAVCASLSGLGVLLLIGGPVGVTGGVVTAVVAWTVLGRSETPGAVRRREEVRRDLPAVVTLVAAALRSGADPGEAVLAVGRALPGAAADRLVGATARLRWGAPAADVWRGLAADPELAPLGRALARATDSGAPVSATVERLADELARTARAEVEDRARAVGVKAAVPLGLCLLPAFVLIGIVPLVAGLLMTLAW